MTHTPDCICIVGVSLPVGVEPDEMPPVSYSVIHCPMHKAAPELLQRLKETRAAIASLPSNALGTAWPDDSPPLFIKNELLGNIDAEIAKATGECNECGGTGTVIVTSSPGFPEHGSIEQESCSKCK